jgi:outer membrane protein assembly factor BamA
VQGAGGWWTATPFQLQVAGPSALRGFGYQGHPAGHRVVVQAEHRYFLGTVFGFADVGSALFTDVGRGWAGDALFGENSALLASVGAGVRVGFPSGSRFTTRMDFAVPVAGGRGAELRFTLRQQFGITRDESSDVERSRQTISTLGLFNVPRN